MNLDEPYLNEEICFLKWLDEFSKKRQDYKYVLQIFLNNVSLLPPRKQERLYNENLHPTQYINLHAHWSETQQGYEYWKVINEEWKTFLFNIEKFKGHPKYKVKKISLKNCIRKLKKLKINFEGE